MDVYFSQVFGVPHDKIVDYGAVNVSLVADLPLFIDPFLLFQSEKADYQKLHANIVSYICYLRDFCASGQPNDDELRHLFCFKEVKQTWLGVSADSNNGRGLGMKFARALDSNLRGFLRDFEKNQVTRGSHIEKLCLVRSGVGKDNISDFVTNLIKDYLLSYTESFAKQHVDSRHRKQFFIRKAVFDFRQKIWLDRSYELPVLGEDFVLLTPKDILTKDDSWINSADLFNQFTSIAESVPNAELRGRVNSYFSAVLPKKASQEERHDAMRKTVERFPELLDFYIAEKENTGIEAQAKNSYDVARVETVFFNSVCALADLVKARTAGRTLNETASRIAFLKDVIENKGGHRFFYLGDRPIRKEEHVQLMFRLTWFGSFVNISREVNDGRGPVDFLASFGALDKTLVEFKLAGNSKLAANLSKQVEIYKKASDAQNDFKVIVFFTAEEEWKVKRLLRELGLENNRKVVLIDARADNKPSGSKAA